MNEVTNLDVSCKKDADYEILQSFSALQMASKK